MEFYASCPEGFETALADELRGLGTPRVRKLKGRVSFEGTALDAERVCLWSRLASRVLLVVGRFYCRDARDLYDGVYDIPWEDILRRGSTIAVSARGTNDELRNSRYISLCVKDAVCDRLADETGSRANVDTDQPDAHITCTLRGERASIQLDLSGEALFRRLPREATHAGAAHVLRPDYAALALAQVGWAKSCKRAKQDGTPCVLVDACCAGGGIALEAASIAAGQAPGIDRDYWGFTSWAEHDPLAWTHLQAEARQLAADSDETASIRIVAADDDQRALSLARRVLKSAGIDRRVIFAQADVEKIAPKLGLGRVTAGTALAGAVVADITEVGFSTMGRALQLVQDLCDTPGLDALPAAVLARDELAERALDRPANASITVRPNNEPARLLVFAGGEAGADGRHDAGEAAAARAPRATVDLGDGAPIPVLVPESDQFAARLKKVARLRRKWAKRSGVTCYRVYDADLPDYAAAIDLYEGSASTPGRWLVLAEYAAPRSVDPELAQARMLDMLAIAPRVLDVEPDHVAARSRTRSRGGSQYAEAGSKGSRGQKRQSSTGGSSPLIEEGGLTFSVNFADYLDTGIFLDHRVTRDLVRQRAQGCKSFLNLFAYTGTATCYAADGGAQQTTTVDLSNTYLDWARRNMELNGFTGRAHRFVRADVLAWVAEQRRAGHTWDLIFCDPPTFSNSSKMGERTWDVQRDHVWLLSCLADLLAPGGLAIFSCNLRTFKPSLDELAAAGVAIEDITAETIPEDFARNAKIHHCYLVRRA